MFGTGGPFGRLWYVEPNAISNAIGYAKFYSRSLSALSLFSQKIWGVQFVDGVVTTPEGLTMPPTILVFSRDAIFYFAGVDFAFWSRHYARCQPFETLKWRFIWRRVRRFHDSRYRASSFVQFPHGTTNIRRGEMRTTARIYSTSSMPNTDRVNVDEQTENLKSAPISICSLV